MAPQFRVSWKSEAFPSAQYSDVVNRDRRDRFDAGRNRVMMFRVAPFARRSFDALFSHHPTEAALDRQLRPPRKYLDGSPA
jgi:hypothetical protein